MSWKYIFNTDLGFGIWRDESQAREAARAAGYSFYIWNQFIISVSDGNPTGISAKEAF